MRNMSARIGQNGASRHRVIKRIKEAAGCGIYVLLRTRAAAAAAAAKHRRTSRSVFLHASFMRGSSANVWPFRWKHISTVVYVCTIMYALHCTGIASSQLIY